MGELFESVVNLVIRPPRFEYRPEARLGPPEFYLDSKWYKRTDLQLKDRRGYTLQCSHYEPVDSERKAVQLPCVVYCHGNSGSRCDAWRKCADAVLPLGITMFTFDFAGCGMSEGEYVTLGYYEKQNLAVVFDYLMAQGRTSRVGIWGRSMGAATALLYSQYNAKVGGLVLDSSFTNLAELINELAASRAPGLLVKVSNRVLQKAVMARAKFDIWHVDPISAARRCRQAALFTHGQDDRFIMATHTERLFTAYSGPKQLLRVEGKHNDARPDVLYHNVAVFFYFTLVMEDPLMYTDLTERYSSDQVSEMYRRWRFNSEAPRERFENYFRDRRLDRQRFALVVQEACKLHIKQYISNPVAAAETQPPPSFMASRVARRVAAKTIQRWWCRHRIPQRYAAMNRRSSCFAEVQLTPGLSPTTRREMSKEAARLVLNPEPGEDGLLRSGESGKGSDGEEGDDVDALEAADRHGHGDELAHTPIMEMHPGSSVNSDDLFPPRVHAQHHHHREHTASSSKPFVPSSPCTSLVPTPTALTPTTPDGKPRSSNMSLL